MRSSPASFIATVGYVRGLKIGRLAVTCEGKRAGGYQCHHGGSVDLAGLADDLPLTAIERRLVCTACGAIGAVDARPDWAALHISDLRPSWMLKS